MPEMSKNDYILVSTDFSALWFWQIKVLNMLNQERAEAERKKMLYMIEQRAAQHREEALRTQVSLHPYC